MNTSVELCGVTLKNRHPEPLAPEQNTVNLQT